MATPAYPLKPNANGRYVVDRNNVPFLIIGDAPHSILANLNNADATTYLTNRGNNGFNVLWIELLCDSYTGGAGTEGSPNYGHDVNGNNPFTSTLTGRYYDLTTPNPAYWSHVDYIVQTAATNGLPHPIGSRRLDADIPSEWNEPLLRIRSVSRKPLQRFTKHNLESGE
jgi:hypothetical protein